MSNILEKLQDAILDGDKETSAELTRKSLNEGIELEDVIEAAKESLKIIGDKFDTGELFLFDLVSSRDAMGASREILEEAKKERGRKVEGRVVLGTEEGDIHNIGKKFSEQL